jgi:phenylacetate-CoA ligase
LARLLKHAALHSPYYRDLDWAARLREGENIRWSELPLTPKAAIKQNPRSFFSDQVPPSEGQVFERVTSGSTGEPSPVKKTARHYLMNYRENRRLKAGWGFERQTGIVRCTMPTNEHPLGTIRREPQLDLPNSWLIHTLEPRATVDLLRRMQCSLLKTYPAQLVAVLELGAPLDFLRLVSTVSEVIPPELPALLARIPQCLHYDAYGSIETGIIAGKCRECGHYHTASRHLLVEILDDDGRPTKQGKMGRVIVTPLFNLAMPLLRYELGDYAVAAADGSCSKSRHALTRIVGRDDNLFVLPDGSRMPPEILPDDALRVGLRKFKLVQTAVKEIDFLYVPATPDTEVPAASLQDIIDRNISPLIRVRPVRMDEIPSSPNGKNLRHECRIAR